MAQDYNFWVYIVTNEHDTVLYIGMTNDLARRITEHRVGEIPGFAADTAVRNWSITSTAQMCWMRSHGKSSSRNGREQRKWH